MKKKKISFAKVRTDHNTVISGKSPAGGALLQTTRDRNGYSLVTSKQVDSIKDRMKEGRFLAVSDLYHFDDRHTWLIEYAIEHDLLGNPYLPISPYSDHVKIIMFAMIRHAFDFDNEALAYALLQYLLSIEGVDEEFINRFIINCFGLLGPSDGVAEISAYHRTKVSEELSKTLDSELSRKLSAKEDSRPLKV